MAWVFFLAGFFFFQHHLLAQQFGFTQFAPRNGLAQSQVRCMAQDKSGYLWIGTLGGVSRFDGLDFTNFGLRDGLPDPQVNALLGASDGTVWLACGSFLVRFDGKVMHTVPLPSRASESRILALVEGTDGSIFVGTDGAGLLQVKNDNVTTPKGWPTDTALSVRTLLRMPDGSLVVGLRNGLLHWSLGGCSPHDPALLDFNQHIGLGKGQHFMGGHFRRRLDRTPHEWRDR